jgi:phosphohistidine phosphatase SixA
VILLRHASAGDRDAWQGHQHDRPLDPRGRLQADALVALLSNYEIDRILSSPAVRCVDTVEPLAQLRGLPIERREELTEELTDTDGLALVRSLAGEDVLLCGHGGLEAALPDQPTWKKGAALVLDETLGVLEVLRPDV